MLSLPDPSAPDRPPASDAGRAVDGHARDAQDEAMRQAILGLLIDTPGLLSVAEVERAVSGPGDDEDGAPVRVLVSDALGHLYRAGLVHRLGEFVFASQAAREAARIDVG